MKEFLKVMKAASDPTRVKMLKLLQKKTLCVCEMHTVLETAQSTTSKHLKILEDAGLIVSKKDGLWVNYTLSDGSQSPYAANLIGNVKHWLDSDPEIIVLQKKLETIDRYKIVDRS